MENSAPHPCILPLSSPQAALENAGGKGVNLARLFQAGFPVPDAFILTTAAYRTFVQTNQLAAVIHQALNLLPDDLTADTLEMASRSIRAAFTRAPMPPDLTQAVTAAYRALGSPPAAVRSSATSEDLPELSFAGQQDTFLNICSESALLEAVVQCWSSLWTARAIGYRARNHIPPEDIELAVVIQRMVESEVSGVLFTANPLSGLRSETVINATWGLGEALVGGYVEPDQYTVDHAQRVITHKKLGSKALVIRGQQSGGVVSQASSAQDVQALPDAQILQLADLSQKVAALYGTPQDIEWAVRGNGIFLLQSRAVTSLFPIPDHLTRHPLHVLFSFGAVQGMLAPLTPLAQDAFAVTITGGVRLFGYHASYQNQTILYRAAERLWIDITPLVRNSVGRRILRNAFNIIEPGTRRHLLAIWDDARLQPGRPGISLPAAFHIAQFALPTAVNVLRNFIRPDQRREHILAQIEKELDRCRQDLQMGGPLQQRLQQIIRAINGTDQVFLNMMPKVGSLLAAGMIALNRLNQLANEAAALETGSAPDAGLDAVLKLNIMRGLPHNTTTEMDMDLWQVAQTIRREPAALQAFQNQSSEQLAAAYQQNALPGAAQTALANFMARYGLRGLAEIDLGRPRWVEDPDYICSVLCSYLNITDPQQAPDAVFERSALEAETAAQALINRLRALPGGRQKARLAALAFHRYRALAGVREAPKFYLVRRLGLIRMALLDCGREMAAAGQIQQADDLFYLKLDELCTLSNGSRHDWRPIIAERRTRYAREMLRRQIPRLLLSDGRAFYDGTTTSQSTDQTFTGCPVSPGVTEGIVHVVLSPLGAQLSPGEILVCPGTDPAWTPLFMTASALVMEVGGMMTHGAVVAREYGIPAVVGVHQATQFLHTGQRIRVNGSTGEIEILS